MDRFATLAKEQWAEARPRLVAKLQKEGTLDLYLQRASDQTNNVTVTSEMLAKLTSRLGELSAKEQYGSSADILAWATNVLTILEAVCGPTDARSKTLRALIEKTSGTETIGNRTFVYAVKGFAKGVHDDLRGGYFVHLTSRIRGEVEGDL
jgi:hypothetical protein